MKFIPNVDLQQRNTLRVPSRAQWFVQASSPQEVQAAVAWAHERQLKVCVLGGGSNVVPLAQVSGLVLQPQIKGISICEIAETGEYFVEAGAGENWHEFVGYCLSRNVPGLENLSLIPGTVGAAPVQNIGAYGVEISEFFDSLQAVNIATGELEEFDRQACAFGYRDSLFKRSGRGRYVIVKVRFRVSRERAVNLSYPALAAAAEKVGLNGSSSSQEISQLVCRIRREKLPDPAAIPNSGSFFKNPIIAANNFDILKKRYPSVVAFPQNNGLQKLAAAWLIDQAGWKGRDFQGVRVHERQALVLTNPQGKGADTVLAAAQAIRQDVLEQFGVELEIEPQIFG